MNNRWDDLRAVIPPDIPVETRGRPRMTDEMACIAILYVMEKGIPWSALPPSMGAKSTVQGRYKSWEPYIETAWPDLHKSYGNRKGVT